MLCGTSNSGAIYKQNGPPVVPRQENESQQCQRIYSSPICTRKPSKSNTGTFHKMFRYISMYSNKISLQCDILFQKCLK